jgi:hypothetical protein
MLNFLRLAGILLAYTTIHEFDERPRHTGDVRQNGAGALKEHHEYCLLMLVHE